MLFRRRKIRDNAALTMRTRPRWRVTQICRETRECHASIRAVRLANMFATAAASRDRPRVALRANRFTRDVSPHRVFRLDFIPITRRPLLFLRETSRRCEFVANRRYTRALPLVSRRAGSFLALTASVLCDPFAVKRPAHERLIYGAYAIPRFRTCFEFVYRVSCRTARERHDIICHGA